MEGPSLRLFTPFRGQTGGGGFLSQPDQETYRFGTATLDVEIPCVLVFRYLWLLIRSEQ